MTGRSSSEFTLVPMKGRLAVCSESEEECVHFCAHCTRGTPLGRGSWDAQNLLQLEGV